MATATQQFEYPVEDWFVGDYSYIPARMQEAIKNYVIDRIQPGQFLRAVICNDLRGAVNYADEENLPLLKLYVQWFYNRAPAPCSGSYDAMQAWLKGG